MRFIKAVVAGLCIASAVALLVHFVTGITGLVMLCTTLGGATLLTLAAYFSTAEEGVEEETLKSVPAH